MGLPHDGTPTAKSLAIRLSPDVCHQCLWKRRNVSIRSEIGSLVASPPRHVVQYLGLISGQMDPLVINSYHRILSRFYDPLFLLKVLGQTRGDDAPSNDRIQQLEQTQLRRFLQNLSYICDFDKGGISCTAIGPEGSTTFYKFWVTSNTVNGRIIDFLNTVLSTLQVVSSSPLSESKSKKAGFVESCIRFAAETIKKETVGKLVFNIRAYQYRVSLIKSLARRLATWIDSIQAIDDNFKFCQFALVEDAGHLSHLLETCHVYAIEPIPPVTQSTPDSYITLHGILNRMLNRNDPMRSKIESALIQLNARSSYFEEYMIQHSHGTPQINLKPACLFCEYFKYHPARMKPPLVKSFRKNDTDSECQRQAHRATSIQIVKPEAPMHGTLARSGETSDAELSGLETAKLPKQQATEGKFDITQTPIEAGKGEIADGDFDSDAGGVSIYM
ncbi:hypothetical protein BDV29DRAFT_193454 [Aspergillus leporis]|uniref:Uncharacterized protein n=1 Tax=Aspergillus leporis TaxID=41062 RepID=A0A5N5WVP6_9EURO|nr:hypothetical protein BDV29DRAFT_193454 [Aspergillus leporis]